VKNKSTSSVSPIKIINSVAPIRICDIGGWTDTWFAGHGQIFNIGVYPYAEVQITVFPAGSQANRITVYPEDFGVPYSMDETKNGEHPLLESAIRRIGLPKDFDILISVHSDAPAACSTGTSASVCVALVAAMCELNQKKITPLEIAYEAHRVETEDLKQQSGIQDQICAAFGGINFIEMKKYPYDNVVTQITLPDNIWWELERRICLVFLGKKHSSSQVHQAVIKNLETGSRDAQALLETLRLAAIKAKSAIEVGDFVAFGQAATDCNDGQRKLHSELICPQADQVLTLAKSYGAMGGKVNGAGGDGGSVTIISGSNMAQKRKMISAILSLNPAFKIIPTYLSRRGLRVWSTTPDI